MKKNLAIGLLFYFLFTFFQGSYPVLCKNSFSENVYITDSIPVNLSESIEIVSANNIDEVKEVRNLWVDDFLIEDKDVRSKVKEIHEKGGRVIIRSSELELADIYEVFDIEQAKRIRNMEEVILAEEKDNVPLEKELPVGYVIINEKEYKHVITLFAECKSDEFVTFEYASKYDYIDFIFNKDSVDEFNIDYNIRSNWGNDWGDWGNAQTNTKTWGNITVSESINLRENSDNPNYAGKYLYYVAYKIDVEPRYWDVGINNIYITTAGNSRGTCTLIDYGPTPGTTSSNGGISFQLSYGLGGVSFSTGTKTKIVKDDGGFDTRFIKHNYYPINSIGLPSRRYDFMRAEGHGMFTTTSSSLYGYGQYKVIGGYTGGGWWEHERVGALTVYVPSS